MFGSFRVEHTAVTSLRVQFSKAETLACLNQYKLNVISVHTHFEFEAVMSKPFA